MTRGDRGRGHARADEEDDADEGSEWRFSIEEVGPDGIVEETSPGPGPIEPESIDPVHATFVALGVVLAVAVVVTAF
ncbi:hypothetical protein ACFQAS_09515 [Halopenitus salinus]|jgi:hypothetical protein|uniref:DUF7312 domain-containing protein n=1 Tax=Halopenitus salinus TaxID=1198295 RepID=A0ABD5US52_9EURY